MVRKLADLNGDGDYEQKQNLAYDGNQVVMDFRRTGSGLVQTGDLEWRYLWGPAVDQILAEENVDNGADETVQWTLTDHLNTVRDIAKYDSGSDMTTDLIYDAFGKVTSESNPAVDSLFHFTARPFDEDTQLQNNLNRWYDAHVGRWLSEDPIGFVGGDGNLYRYVANRALLLPDPFGEQPGTTGPCTIALYVGHGIWPIRLPGQTSNEDPAVARFREKHDISNAAIVTGCGNYLGYVGCGGSNLNAGVTRDRQIPGMPTMRRVSSDKLLDFVKRAIQAARSLRAKLCENRKKFCDDGRPERYKCGPDMQRCDSVTITVTCDEDAKALLASGVYQKRPWPGGPIVATWRVPGLPTEESKSICGFKETINCLE